MTSTNQARGIAIVEMEEKNSDSILIAQLSDCSGKNSLMLPFRSPTTVLLRTTVDSVLLSRNTQKWLKSLYFPNIRGEVTVLQRLRQSGESSLFESLLGTRMLMEAMQIFESPWRWTDSEKVSFLGARMYWLHPFPGTLQNARSSLCPPLSFRALPQSTAAVKEIQLATVSTHWAWETQVTCQEPLVWFVLLSQGQRWHGNKMKSWMHF